MTAERAPGPATDEGRSFLDLFRDIGITDVIDDRLCGVAFIEGVCQSRSFALRVAQRQQ